MSGASGNFQEQERAGTWISKNNIVKKKKKKSRTGDTDLVAAVID